MSLEAITEIREVEERTERAKAEARAQAQKLAADAERDGKALLRQARTMPPRLWPRPCVGLKRPPPSGGRRSWQRQPQTAGS